MEKDYALSKSALKDRDVKESTFLVSWSQAGIFIYKGEYRGGGRKEKIKTHQTNTVLLVTATSLFK